MGVIKRHGAQGRIEGTAQQIGLIIFGDGKPSLSSERIAQPVLNLSLRNIDI